jgi:hypothetical protein
MAHATALLLRRRPGDTPPLFRFEIFLARKTRTNALMKVTQPLLLLLALAAALLLFGARSRISSATDNAEHTAQFASAPASPPLPQASPLPASLPPAPLLKVFFATTTTFHLTMLKVAIRSAHAVGSYMPIVIVHPDDALQPKGVLQLNETHNATVVVHEFAWAPEIKRALVRFAKLGTLATAMGACARFDVPILAASMVLGQPVAWVAANLGLAAAEMNKRSVLENYVLYTDSDVVFMESMSAALHKGEIALPRIFAASSELDVKNYDSFNTGVMLFNVSGFLNAYEDIHRFLVQNEYRCLFLAWDQSCLQRYSKQRASFLLDPGFKLFPQWNWRPYLHWPADTVPPGTPIGILHLHGPKPLDLLEILTSRVAGRRANLSMYGLGIWAMNRKGGMEALLKWTSFFIEEM